MKTTQQLGKILVAAFLLASITGAAAAQTELEGYEYDGDVDHDYYYNVSAPKTPAEIGAEANNLIGFAGSGVLIITWMVFFSIPHRRGFDNLSCAISADIITTTVSLMLYPMEWISGEVVILMFAVTAGTLAYSRITG